MISDALPPVCMFRRVAAVCNISEIFLRWQQGEQVALPSQCAA